MLENLKKLVSYYKPYKKVFLADMFFAIMASFIALLIPLVVRYVTAKVIYMPAEQVASLCGNVSRPPPGTSPRWLPR